MRLLQSIHDEQRRGALFLLVGADGIVLRREHGGYQMLVGVKGQNQQGICFLLLLAVGTATLAGCVGRKYGFPGFGAKQTSNSEAKEQPAEKSSISKEKTESNLDNVASLEGSDKPTILTAASRAKESADNSKPGVAHIANTSGSSSQETEVEEVDQAFLEWAARNSESQKEVTQDVAQEELGNYKKLVSEVEQGTSSLDALKASLAKLNENRTPAKSPEQSAETVPTVTRDLHNSRKSDMTPRSNDDVDDTVGIATVSVPGLSVPGLSVPELSVSESNSAKETDLSLEFPWFSNPDQSAKAESEIANREKQYPQNDSNRIRELLVKARKLIRENNLLEARLIAETAKTIKKKTEAVFTSEEITPEQILAEIAQRERERNGKLLTDSVSNNRTEASSRTARETDSPQKRQSAPVVIDLSREWLNSTETSSGSLDDVARFEHSTATSNRAARLPVITPAGEPNYAKPQRREPERREIEIISYDTAIKADQGGSTELPEAQRVLLLGDDSGSNPAADKTSTPVAGVSLPPLDIGTSEKQNDPDIQLENDLGSAPRLIAPEVTSGEGEKESSEFDEFAAGFAEAGIETSSEIEEAPLLIDEEELRSHATDSPRMSATTLILTICGIAFAVMMFVRWRR